MKTVNLERISLLADYCSTSIEGDSNLDCCISIISTTILEILKSADGDEEIDSRQMYNMTHVLRTLEEMRSEIRIIKEGGEA